MKEIIDFLYANPRGCLASIDDEGRPHVRPWEFMFEQDAKLWFCTGNTKDVFYQIQCNPVSGEVIFGIDLNIKRKMLETNDLVKSIYKTPENTEFEIFYLKHGQATMFDISGQLRNNLVF